MSNSRVTELYGRHMDGLLSPEEEAELAELLRDPAAQREWRLAAALEAKLQEELRDAAAAAPARRTIRWGLWAPLAAAALLIAGFGVFALFSGGPTGPRYAMGRLTKSIGQVRISDRETASGIMTTVETRSNSSCRVDQPDGTVIAMDAETRADWLQERASGAKNFNLSGGQAYLDIARQDQSFVVAFGPEVQAQVLGTRLLVDRGKTDKPYFNVMEGRIRIRHGESAAYVPAGGVAKLWSGMAGGPVNGLAVFSGVVKPEALAWLDALGLDSRDVLARATRSKTPYPEEGFIDCGTYAVMGGSWRLDRRADGMAWIQENERGPARLILGRPRLLNGEFSCKFKLLRISGDSPNLQVMICYNNLGMESFGTETAFLKRHPVGTVYSTRMAFEVDPQKNTTTVRDLAVWVENTPVEKWKGDLAWVKSPENSSLKQRGPCGMGFFVGDCSAEIWDLKLTNVVALNDVPSSGGAGTSVPAGTVLFQDDFEHGINDWEFVSERAAIVAGEGVDGSHALRLTWDKGKRAAVLSKYVNPHQSYEVSFMIRMPSAGAISYGTHVAPAGSWPTHSTAATILYQKSYKPIPVGAWLRHTTVIRGLFKYETLWQGETKLLELHSKVPDPFSRIGIYVMEAGKETLYVDNVVIRKLDDESSARAELWPWVADYYKRHDQWVLQREKFTDGDLHAVLSPAQIKRDVPEGNARLKLVRQAMKDGKEGEALSVENASQAYYVARLSVPGGLPDAFAVEIDLKPLRVIPAAGESTVSAPFQYEGGDGHVDGRSETLDVPGLPGALLVEAAQGFVNSSGPTLGRWGQYRVEYFRVGRLQTGGSLYEVRLPQTSGSGVRLTWKRNDAIVMSFRGSEVILGEVRVKCLMPPANLELGPASPPAK